MTKVAIVIGVIGTVGSYLVDVLIGGVSKTKKKLGWNSVAGLQHLCATIVASNLRCNKQGTSF
jgi:GDP-D-mannose dehydratase